MARFTRPRGFIEKKLAEELGPREKAAAIAEPVPAVAGVASAPAQRRSSKAPKRKDDDDDGEAKPLAAE
jgi:hypothetical protein